MSDTTPRGRGFANQPLGNAVAVGLVTARAVRLWMRSERPGTLRVAWRCADAAESCGECVVPVAARNDNDNTVCLEIKDLRPLQRYAFDVWRQDSTADGTAEATPIGSGCFETAPASATATPAHFSIALMSCNQPFDDTGAIRADATQMLRALRKRMSADDVKLALFVGDQMYSDAPEALSLFDSAHFEKVAPAGRKRLLDCTTAQVRTLYQERYRHFWNIPEFRQLQAEHACYMIWDDHDIVDNWGSDPAHQRPPWATIGDGARQACYDYQASRVLEPDAARDTFAYSIEYGCIAIHVMDLRSERRAGHNGRLYSDVQRDNVARFLATHADKPAVFIVLSVPAIHLPKRLSQILGWLIPFNEDFSDRWSSGEHVYDRDHLLHTLRAHQQQHPGQRVVLLSGDIHIGCVHEIRWQDGGSLYQFVSSGITHAVSKTVGWVSKMLIRAHRELVSEDHSIDARVRLLDGARNPYGQLNFGIIECERRGDALEMQFKLYGHHGEEPVCVYRSEPISAHAR